MLKTMVMPVLARVLKMEYSSENVTVANMGESNMYEYNQEFKQWVKRGEKPKPIEILPPPPTRRVKTDSVQDTAAGMNALDALLTVPRHTYLKFQQRNAIPVVRNPQTSLFQQDLGAEIGAEKPQEPLLPTEVGNHKTNEQMTDDDLPKPFKLHTCTETDRARGPAKLCKENAQLRQRLAASRRLQAVIGARRFAQELSQKVEVREEFQGDVEQVVAVLVSITREKHQNSTHALSQSMRALWQLSFCTDMVDAFVRCGGIMQVLALMSAHGPSEEIQLVACGLLQNIAEKEIYRAAISQHGGLALITSAMRRHSGNADLLQLGCQVLYVLALTKEMQSLVLKAGGGDLAKQAAIRPGAFCGVVEWGWRLLEVLDYPVHV